MTEDLLSKFTLEERDRLNRLRREVRSGQRSEDPERALVELAEDIRARVEERVRNDGQAKGLLKEDQDKGLSVTRLGIRLQTKSNSETEKINLGIVMGKGGENENGTVLISRLLVKWNESGNSVETTLTKAEILGGGRFKIRQEVVHLGDDQRQSQNYSAVYPRPDRSEFGEEIQVLDPDKARIVLQGLEFWADRCLSQPNSSFHRSPLSPATEISRSKPAPPSLTDKIGS